MVVSFNEVLVAGTLTQNVDFRYTKSGKPMAKFSIYVPSKAKPSYMDIVAFDELAERCNARLQKAVAVFIKGRIDISVYTDKQDIKRKSISIMANIVYSPAFGDNLDELIPKREYNRKPRTEKVPPEAPPKESFDYHANNPVYGDNEEILEWL